MSQIWQYALVFSNPVPLRNLFGLAFGNFQKQRQFCHFNRLSINIYTVNVVKEYALSFCGS